LCCDVDGVLTDGGLYYGEQGEEPIKRFHVLDGMGIKMLLNAGISVCFVSQGKSSAISARARALGIEYCFTGIENKVEPVTALMAMLGIAASEVAHIADDVNDISLIDFVGVAVTVPGGVIEVRRRCKFVTQKEGGAGAVRELCEAILASQALWPSRGDQRN